MNGLTWTCHICGDERPDDKIGVRVTDVSIEHGMQKGELTQNVRHCMDRSECVLGARNYKFPDPSEVDPVPNKVDADPLCQAPGCYHPRSAHEQARAAGLTNWACWHPGCACSNFQGEET